MDSAFEARIAAAGTAAAGKWGGFPRGNALTNGAVVEVRRKNNAKWNKGDSNFGNTRAASAILRVAVTVDGNNITAVNLSQTPEEILEAAVITLGQRIAAAEAILEGLEATDSEVLVVDDPDDPNAFDGFADGQKWVTLEDVDALEEAVGDAQEVLDDANATLLQVNAAVTALNTAITAFNDAIETYEED